jgi:hypothetical protein
VPRSGGLGTVDALQGCAIVQLLKIVTPSQPAIRTPPAVPVVDKEEEPQFVLGGVGFLCGPASRLFLGIIMGGAAIFAAGHIYKMHERTAAAAEAPPALLATTRTDVVSASQHEIVSPAPIVVQIDSNLIHVTAIAMGHPRLAVINGQTVAEGGHVKLSSPVVPAAVSLRVVKIGDGTVQLTDGRQKIVAHLAYLYHAK